MATRANLTSIKPPDLRKVRILLIRALDLLPAAGPEWHPTFRAARQIREHVRDAKRELEAYLGPED
jgi:hypothetical protein